MSWYNPTSWSGNTWLNIGVTGLSIAELIPTLGADAPAVAAQDAAIEAGMLGSEEAAAEFTN